MAGESEQMNSKRLLFYSHGTMGLGHLRRTLLICEGLRANFQNLSSLIVTGSAMAHGFRMSPGIDYVKLPSVTKLDNEQYTSRSLALEFEEIRNMREQILLQTTLNYKPDFFFVDNVPLGMRGEARKALAYVKDYLPHTPVFLILRDILDSSGSIVSHWQKSNIFEAIDHFYDRIFICGLPVIFNPVAEYQFPESVVRKTSFGGYIARPFNEEAVRCARQQFCPNREKLIVVTVGGGSDGADVVENFLSALPRVCRELPVASAVLLGPEMDPEIARRLKSGSPDGCPITFIDFHEDALAYLAAADLVVSMAGYNTISEILYLHKKAIVIPRIWPRTEQLIRSRRLQELGLLKMIHPGNLDPQSFAQKMIDGLNSPGIRQAFLKFDAVANLTAELETMAGRPSGSHAFMLEETETPSRIGSVAGLLSPKSQVLYGHRKAVQGKGMK